MITFHAIKSLIKYCILLPVLLVSACSDKPWNNPYSEESGNNVLFSSFSERPKHLDPARSYSSNEYAIIGQIYEPPLQYHFLKRPYTLEPLAALAMPNLRYFNQNNVEVDEDSDDISYSEYQIEIKPGMNYQSHPAFAKSLDGSAVYLDLQADDVSDIYQLGDFSQKDSREVTAADYVYQIKRLANPNFHSPILGLMGEYIDGLTALSKELKSALQDKEKSDWIDLRQFNLEGVKAISRYQYSIRIKGVYPQFRYWLSMPFFAPMPFEVERFYQQPQLIEKNITLNWYPVGSGPYQLSVNNPNKQMILTRNENFHGANYPSTGEPQDEANGLLKDQGLSLPFIDKIVFSLEKESIPYWNKFLQGYYDTSGISSDSFDQAVEMGSNAEVGLTEGMTKKGIKLKTNVETSLFYFGFNMLDDVVGGLSDKNTKLRQAISIVVDYEEYISIFLNGRGLTAHGPVPPGIFGFVEGSRGINTTAFDVISGKASRKTIAQAKELLAQAGYKNGINSGTGLPLILYLDTTGSGPDSKARLAWWRKQFDKLNIQLVIRNTDYNRFQDKMLKGTEQMFMWGWNADYPDPENFMFLLYGKNGKVKFQGENAANYFNPEFDLLFEQMKDMRNSPERLTIIEQMTSILQHDSPWIWGIVPKAFSLHHAWFFNSKPNAMAHNTLMYKRINPQLRQQKQSEWNQPVLWPFGLLFIVLIGFTLPAWITWKRSETRKQLDTGNSRYSEKQS